MNEKECLIVGLDVGTTKVCAVVGEQRADGQVAVLGVGTKPSAGLRKGVVVNVEETVEAIQGAIEEAELQADCEIRTVYVGVAGGQFKSFNSHGIVAVKDGEVKGNDVRRVIEAARAVAIPADREILHVLPVGYVVDDHGGIREPQGIRGTRLEVHCHIVTTTATTTATLLKCCHRTGLRVADLILEPLAAAEAVLTAAERQMGVAMVDIGGGTTDLIVVCNGSVRHTAILALGGHHVTMDIAKILRTPVEPAAEELKVRHGAALGAEVPDAPVPVPTMAGDGDRAVSRQVLCGIIEKRVEEILELVRREIEKSGYSESLTGGIVLTGGTARLPGLVALAGRIFDVPIRVGGPTGLGGLVDLVEGPEHATAAGLMLYGFRHGLAAEAAACNPRGFGGMVVKMREWFKEFF
jgi:cell division protein FtsA